MAGDDADVEMRRHSSLVASGIGLSRMTGLVREATIGFFLGGDASADAFRAALRVPNLLQNLLGEGVLSASFIPTYARLLAQGRERDAGYVAGAVAGLLTVTAGVVIVLGVVFAEPITSLIAFGFTGERLELTVTLTRIMFPGIGVLVLSAWCLGVLNSHRRFFLSYVAPVLWNAGIVATVVAFGASGVLRPAIALGWGVVVGGIAQLLVQVPAVRRLTAGTVRFSLDRRDPNAKRVLSAFGPIVAGRGVVQLTTFLDIFVASFLAVGAIAVLGYAQALYLLPVGLFGMSVAAAELPALSTGEPIPRQALRGRLDQGLARIGFFVVGATVAYVWFGDAIVELLFGRGAFGPATSVQVAVVLAVYALGLLPTTSSRLLQSVLYGSGDAKRPAAIAAGRVVLGLAIAVPLMFTFDRVAVDMSDPGFGSIAVVEGASLPAITPVDAELRDADPNQLRLGAVGLGVGSTFAAWLEYLLLCRAVDRRFGTAPRLGGGTLPRLLLAGGAATAVALVLRSLLAGRISLVVLLVAGVASAATYLGVAAGLGLHEPRELLDAITRRWRR